MTQEIKKTLAGQLELLNERSKSADTKDLPKLTAQIINLATILDPELRNLSLHADFARLPSVALTAQDAADIANARRERYLRWEASQKEELIVANKES